MRTFEARMGSGRFVWLVLGELSSRRRLIVPCLLRVWLEGARLTVLVRNPVWRAFIRLRRFAARQARQSRLGMQNDACSTQASGCPAEGEELDV